MAGTAEDQGPLVLGVVISMLTIGGIFIFARVISRAIIKPSFGFDDALIIITWVCCRKSTENLIEALAANIRNLSSSSWAIILPTLCQLTVATANTSTT